MRKLAWILGFLILIFTLVQAEEDLIYDDKGKRDPFSPLVDANGQYASEEGSIYSPAELKVSGILWDPQGKSSCLINNQIVNTGQTLYGFTIKYINKDSVTVAKDNEEFILKLPGGRNDQ